MRILAIANLYPLSVEDFAGHFNHLCFRALCRQGHDVNVFRCQSRFPFLLSRQWHRLGRQTVQSFYNLEGVPVTCPRFWRPPGQWWCPYEGRQRYKAIARVAVPMHRRRPFDIIYGCELTPDGVAAASLARDLNLPLMVSSIGSDAHTYPYMSRAFMRRTQRVVREANLILVESAGAVDAVRALVPEQLPIRVFNRGIDLVPFRRPPGRETARRRLGLPLGRRLIVLVSLLGKNKGVQVLVDAFGRLENRFPDVDLVFVGSGPLSAWLARQVASLPWGHRLHAIGRRPFNEIPDVLSACDVFCLPSFAEGLPKSVIEAMAAGLPVVATTVGGIPEVVQAGASGILIPARDPVALEAGLAELLGDPDKAAQMGKVGRQIALERYDTEKNSAELVVFARQAIARAAKKPGNSC
ncbi:MAG: glycosyltransferase [Phycisphaerales bacterium]|nr:MAG: glycosyltransferase [Phycisphaerales bacterium]